MKLSTKSLFHSAMFIQQRKSGTNPENGLRTRICLDDNTRAVVKENLSQFSRIGLIILFLGIVIGCHSVVIDFQNSPPITAEEFRAQQDPVDVNRAQGSMINGIFAVSAPLESPCEQPEYIIIHRNWIDHIIHFTIGGIYTTRRIAISCEI